VQAVSGTLDGFPVLEAASVGGLQGKRAQHQPDDRRDDNLHGLNVDRVANELRIPSPGFPHQLAPLRRGYSLTVAANRSSAPATPRQTKTKTSERGRAVP
jgi:hypothetical protein